MSRARDVSNIDNIPTAKGDIYAATAASTPARIGVGSNDQVLVSDSTTSTGLAWKSYGAQHVAGKNYFLNSAMEIWQRGTSFTSPAGAYTADRWKATVNGAGTYVVSRQSTGLAGLPFCLRLQRSAGQTYAAYGTFLGYAWETDAMIGLQGKTVTYSVYARRGANHSDSNGASINLWWGTGSGTHAFSSLTNETNAITGTLALTTSWQRFTFTGTIPSNATELRTNISWQTTGTAGADDFVEITGLQLEAGSVATPFSRAGGVSLQEELALCQRYYQRFNADGSGYTYFGIGSGHNTGSVFFSYWLKQKLRAVPTVFETSGVGTFFAETHQTSTVTSLTSILLPANVSSTDILMIEAQKSASFTAGQFYRLVANANGNAYIAVGAEL